MKKNEKQGKARRIVARILEEKTDQQRTALRYRISKIFKGSGREGNIETESI